MGLAEAWVAYLALGLEAIFGALLILGRPKVLSRERLAHTVIDSALVGALVAGTGGESSPFFLLFFLAALGILRLETPAKAVAATAAVVGAYLAATVAAGDPGMLWSTSEGLEGRAPRSSARSWGCGLRDAQLQEARLRARLGLRRRVESRREGRGPGREVRVCARIP